MTRLDRPQIIVHASLKTNHTACATRWLPGTPRFAALAVTSKGMACLQLNELCNGAITTTHEGAYENPLTCSAFSLTPSGCYQLVTGDDKGNILFWDLKQSLRKPVEIVKSAHSARITCLDACGSAHDAYGPPEICSSSDDGCIRVFDVRQPGIAVSQIDPAQKSHVPSCWTVGFGNSYNTDDRHVAAGYDNGDFKIYDLRDLSLHYSANLGNGVCSLQYDRWDIKANKVVIGTLEANMYVYDLRTFHKTAGYAHLKEKISDDNSTTWCIRHLPQNREIWAALSGNGNLTLYKYKYPNSRTVKSTVDGLPEGVAGSVEILNESTVAEQPVPNFDWSPDKLGLCVFPAYDQVVRVGVVTKLNTY